MPWAKLSKAPINETGEQPFRKALGRRTVPEETAKNRMMADEMPSTSCDLRTRVNASKGLVAVLNGFRA